MRKFLLFTLVTLLALTQWVQAIQAGDALAPVAGKTDDSQLVRLANGLTVYVIRDTRFPLVCTRLYVRAGSANELPSQAGISHVLEHMVFKGTEKRPKGQIARDVESLGGYLNAATSFDKTWYLTDMPAAHWRMGMDVVRDMAVAPSLDPAELEAEKDVIVSELQRGKDSPTSRLFEELQTATLARSPYGHPIIGYEETIRSLTVQDLRGYIKRWYQPRNMLLLVAGDIVPADVLAHAQELFGGLSNHGEQPVPEPLDVRSAAAGPKVMVQRGPWKKIYLGVAFPAPSLTDLRSLDLDLASYLLAGDGTAWLNKKYVYEKQLATSISVGNMSLARAGLMLLTAELEPEKIEPFWQELSHDLGNLDKLDFGPAALARAKLNIEDSMDRVGETLNGLASWQGTVQFDLGGEQGERNLRLALNDASLEQIRTVLGQWVRPELARIRVLAPQEATLPNLGKIFDTNWPASQSPVEDKKAVAQGPQEVLDMGDGRKLILIPDATAPYVSLDFVMPGGNALLQPQQQGLASLTARLLTAGYGSLSQQDVERFFAERAASASARAGLQSFSISLTGPSRFNEDYFKALGQMLREPTFAASELEREVNLMQAAIRQRADRPLAYAFARLMPFLYPDGQPYGLDSLGTPESLVALQQSDVRAFWHKQLAQPWVLAVAGSFEREAVLAFAQSLPRPEGPALTVAPPHWGTQQNLDLRLPGRSQAHLLQVFKTVPLTHEDAPALMLLGSVLSGQSGLLFSSLRDEQGLGYSVTAFNRLMPEAGYLAFYIGTTPDKLAQARDGFAKVIAELKTTPLPEATLQAGANRLLGEYLRDRQSLGSRASESASDAVLDLPQGFQKILLEKARQLTPAQVQDVARKYLVEAGAYELSLEP